MDYTNKYKFSHLKIKDIPHLTKANSKFKESMMCRQPIFEDHDVILNLQPRINYDVFTHAFDHQVHSNFVVLLHAGKVTSNIPYFSNSPKLLTKVENFHHYLFINRESGNIPPIFFLLSLPL